MKAHHDGNSALAKFETLFANARHYRGDCRLMRTAVRGGWMNNAPQSDLDALVARFGTASAQRQADDPDAQNVRAMLAETLLVVEMDRATVDRAIGVLRYAWAGELTGRTTGRPRERWHVSDSPNRIDANEVRRRAKADGIELRTLSAVGVWRVEKPDDAGERVALSVVADARYGWRLWLVCPRCRDRKTHLYPLRAGVGCRRCAGIR